MNGVDSAVCTPNPSAAPGFASTLWSVIQHAVGDAAQKRQSALAALCKAYWFPLYAYLRGTGISVEDAEDLTQGFFAHLLETHALDTVRREKGRFRTFLLVSLKHYVSNQARAARAAKRGGGAPVISIDADFAEATLSAAVHQETTPDQCYAQSWGRTLLLRVLSLLQAEFDAAGKQDLFIALQPYLTGNASLPTYQQLGERLGISKTAVGMSVHRMRRRYGELLRMEISRTVGSEEEVEEEIEFLFRTFDD